MQTISKEKREEAVDYSLDAIKHICDDIGPRESGTPNERKAQDWLKEELLNNKWADEAVIDEFQVSRHGLVGFSKIVATFLLIAVLASMVGYFVVSAYVVLQIIALLFIILSLAMFLFEFVLYKPFVDLFLPKSTSSNVYAKYHSSGETKKRIIFSGHCDSAYEWTLMKVSPTLMIAVLIGSLIGALLFVALIIVSLVIGKIPMWSVAINIIFAPFYFGLYYMCNFKKVVPGANDNLTGVLASMSVLKCLKETDIRFENTEVAVLLTGSEEAGLRGARAWAKKYKDEIKTSSIDTVFISLETFRDWDHFCIYSRDMTMTVGHDKGVINLLKKATTKAGRPLKTALVPFGASDGAAVTKEGLRACCVAGMDPKPANYYHNMKDTADNMDRKSLAFGVDIAIESAFIFNEEGAPEN
ncbi:MAG: M20/M25/M40 family metallo-hydrolase [Clostridia bacterium]